MLFKPLWICAGCLGDRVVASYWSESVIAREILSFVEILGGLTRYFGIGK